MTSRKASTQTPYGESNQVTRRYRVKSDTSDNTYTVVAIETFDRGHDEVEWRCSCRGWTMHTPRRDCKHITHVKNNAM